MFWHRNREGLHMIMPCSTTYWRLLMSKIIWALRLTNDTLWLLFNCYYQMPNWLHLTNWCASHDSYPTYRVSFQWSVIKEPSWMFWISEILKFFIPELSPLLFICPSSISYWWVASIFPIFLSIFPKNLKSLDRLSVLSIKLSLTQIGHV